MWELPLGTYAYSIKCSLARKLYEKINSCSSDLLDKQLQILRSSSTFSWDYISDVEFTKNNSAISEIERSGLFIFDISVTLKNKGVVYKLHEERKTGRVAKEYEDTDLKNDIELCEMPSLPKNSLHIVIAGYKHREVSEDYSYLFSLSNTEIFHYRRQFATMPLVSYPEICGVVVNERLMLPNIGREAAAFFDYAYEHYDNPPKVIAFLHGHAAISWHTTCNGVYSRLLQSYRDLISDEFPFRMFTLAGNRKQNIYSPNPFPGRLRRRLQLEPEDQLLVDKCGAVFEKYNKTILQVPGQFGSCCATFILPGDRLHWYPKDFYLTMRNYHLLTTNEDMAGRYCFEFIIYPMYCDALIEETDRIWYQKALNLSLTLSTKYHSRLERCYANQAPDITD
jgi:hypothetical protein